MNIVVREKKTIKKIIFGKKKTIITRLIKSRVI